MKVICPYCGKQAKLVKNEVIYGRTYGNGWAYLCKPCEAYVGLHDNGKPLGVPAKKELRQLRMKAHDSFDKIWKAEKSRLFRTMLYKALSKYMGLSEKETHIGSFNEEQCKKVLEFTRDYI